MPTPKKRSFIGGVGHDAKQAIDAVTAKPMEVKNQRDVFLKMFRDDGMTEQQAHQMLREVAKYLQKKGALRKPTKAEKKAEKAAKRAAK